MGEEATPEEMEATFGVRQLIGREFIEELVLWFNEPEAREVGVPGAGGFGRAADLALFYQELLHNPNGIWKPELLADVTGHVRSRLPDPMKVPANRSLGLLLAGDDGYANIRGLGRTVSPGAFGHNGAGGQLAWADPATGLSLGYTTNGYDRHAVRQPRRGTSIGSIAGGVRHGLNRPGPGRPTAGNHEEPGRGGSTRLFIRSLPAPEGGSTLGSSTRST